MSFRPLKEKVHASKCRIERLQIYPRPVRSGTVLGLTDKDCLVAEYCMLGLCRVRGHRQCTGTVATDGKDGSFHASSCLNHLVARHRPRLARFLKDR